MRPTVVPKTDRRPRVAIVCLAGVAGLIAVSAGFVAGWQPSQRAPIVGSGGVSHQRQPAGTIAAPARHAVSFGAPRVVDRVEVTVGSTVRVGDVIATLKPTDDTELRGLEQAVADAERSLHAAQETPPTLVVPGQEQVVLSAQQAVARAAKSLADATRALEQANHALDDEYRRLIATELRCEQEVRGAEAGLEDRIAALVALQADPSADPQATLDAEAAVSAARNALAEARASLQAARQASNERLDEGEVIAAREALAAAEVAHADRCDEFENARAKLVVARTTDALTLATRSRNIAQADEVRAVLRARLDQLESTRKIDAIRADHAGRIAELTISAGATISTAKPVAIIEGRR